MANEFIARNGLISQNNSVVTGSLIVTAGITGSLFGTSSYTIQALSASYAATASYATQALSASYAPSTPAFPYTGTAIITGSLDVTSGITGSLLGTASYAIQALSASWAPSTGGGGGATPVKLTSQTILSSSWVATGSYYTSSFTDSNIDSTCDISVTPQPGSYQTAYNAQILPYIRVATGTGSFYSQFPPSANIVVDIVITQTS